MHNRCSASTPYCTVLVGNVITITTVDYDDDDDSTKGFRLKEYNDKMSTFVAQEHDWNERKR